MSRRAGLTPDRVLDEAVALTEERGLDALSTAELALRLGVRTPSLYKHVASLDEVRAGVVARAAEAVADAVEAAALGRARDDAARRLAHAWRDFGRTHPRLAAALPVSHVDQPPAALAAMDRVLRALLAVFSGYGLAGDDLIHAVRGFRAAVSGFVQLEAAGGFALDVDPDESFRRLVDTLLAGLAAQQADGPAQVG